MSSSTSRGGWWSRWAHWPRETRDTLFLLAVIAWVVGPHVAHLPVWCSALAGVVLLWRAWLALAGRPLPSRWMLALLLLASLGATWLSHRSLVGKEAGVTMVVVLMALKTLELRARRDAFVVFFLGFFLVLTHFLYSQSLLLAVAMVVAVWGLLTSLVLAHMPVGHPSLRNAGGLAARMCLFGAPVMVALFLLFPRFGPLWGVPSDASGSRTGLSDVMAMGTVAELALDDTVAMRLRFNGQEPPPEAMYFRGPVLSQFNGREWLPARRNDWRPEQRVAAALQLTGRPWQYEVTVEPTRVPVLALLEVTSDVKSDDDLRVRRYDDLQWGLPRPLMERRRFAATAYSNFRHGPEASVPGLQQYLELPAGYNPRTLAWAAALRQDPRLAQANARALAEAVLRHIRTQGYAYTLSPGIYGDERGRHAIDEFWLDGKQGFCEHFAGAFVVVMRALGVPARVVTGYQGAERNPVDGYYLVRNSFAHAWAEYWQQGQGWVRADPTAAAAPARVTRPPSLRPNQGLVSSVFDTVDPTAWRHLQHRWDALNNAWSQWVLNYSQGRQRDLLKGLGFDTPSWRDLALLLALLVAAASAGGAVWAWWGRQRQDPWLRLYHRMRMRLADAGLESGPHTPPRELAQRALQRFGERAAGVAALLNRLEAERYGPPPAGGRGASTLTRSLARDLRRALAHLDHA
ncbi:transglutaminase TgpA family protein [Caldimonas brevitalea]|uniref:Transglutaminase n=1 Tax=Caldimonas brevitalea TaxID=413882 RepID=A0A0G3BM19_9BURK|nr:DUF3488 and transglutaminase-like domain-containing protein [Caldimonas brevitalea]AKJ28401.1 transglutaminase [Caldimonas brevitalea]